MTRSLRFRTLGLAVLVLTFFAPTLRAEVCTGDITLATQADVDAFTCTTVTGAGELYIGGDRFGDSDITTLAPLINLTQAYFVRIMYNPGLTSLAGLDNLTDIRGHLEIRDNHGLTSLSGLDALERVPGDFYLWFNSSLTSLGALSQLTVVLHDLVISHNDVLPSLAGLEGLSRLGGLSVSNNPALTALAPFSSLTEVSGNHASENVSFGGNGMLTSLAGLESLVTIGGSLELEYTALTSLSGLSGLETVGGEFYVEGNSGITSLADLAGLTSLHELYINGSALTSLTGLEGLSALGGNLAVENNASLTSLDGLENLESIGSGLYIAYNDLLASLAALSSLTSIGDEFAIEGNALLSDCFSGLKGTMGYAGSPGIPGFTNAGSFQLIDGTNAVGCQSEAELIDMAYDFSATLLDERRGNPVASTATDPMWISFRGEKVYYQGTISNHLGSAFTTETWPSVTLPSGDVVTRRRAKTFTAEADGSRTYNGAVNFAEALPPGLYVITAYIGTHDSAPLEQVELFVRKGGVPRTGAPPLSRAETIALAEASFFGEDDLEMEAAADTASHPGPSAEATRDALPAETGLGSAYPNPFNPSATVPFTLAQDGEVRLAVYDLLGREVAVLVQGPMSAGSHTARFDAGLLPSGTYLVRFSTQDGHRQTQRLTLVK